jgi:hypothetical protein
VDKLSSKGQKLVDVEILDAVLNAAKARLVLVRAAEEARDGVSTTTLANVGRQSLLKWEPPPGKEGTACRPTRYRRVRTDEIRQWLSEKSGVEVTGPITSDQRDAYRRAHDITVSPFRFTLPLRRYEETKVKIHGCSLSVAGVVQDGLEAFAQTGKF